MTDGSDIRAARERARLARAQLTADVERLRHRTSPKVVARETSQRASHAATDAVRARPALFAGGAAALALLLASPLIRRAGRAVGRVAWRNRAGLGQLVKAKRAAPKYRKDHEQ